jgi:hypothetical protein
MQINNKLQFRIQHDRQPKGKLMGAPRTRE